MIRVINKLQQKEGNMDLSIYELVILSKQDIAYTVVLWDRLKPLCLKWVNKFNKEQEDIEGLYQETYMILLKAIEAYDLSQGKKFESYFKILLYRWGYNYQHKKKEVLLMREEEDGRDHRIDEDACTEAQGILNIQLEKLYKALKYLEQDEYELLVAFYVRQERIKEISRRKGVSEQAIESRKRRLLKKIKKICDGF